MDPNNPNPNQPPNTPPAADPAGGGDDSIVFSNIADPKVNPPAADPKPGDGSSVFSPEETAEMKTQFQQALAQETKKIHEEFDKKFGGKFDEINARAALNDFLSSKEGQPYAPYKDKLLKNIRGMNAIKGVGNFVAAVLGPEVLMKIGASLDEQARAAANLSGNGGGSNRQVDQSQVDKYKNMSDEDFAKQVNNVIRGKRA